MSPAHEQQRPSAGRRRLIKLGAGAVPVALTLSSRPVMAFQCNTTSAWGSAILNAGGASVQARAAGAVQEINPWSISEVAGTDAPWLAVYNARYAGAITGDNAAKSAHAKATLKVADLFPGGISGFTDAAPPTTAFNQILANPNTGNFVTAILTAGLNFAFNPQANLASCLSNQPGGDALTVMAQGMYSPSNGMGHTWTNEEVLRYLTQSNIVRS